MKPGRGAASPSRQALYHLALAETWSEVNLDARWTSSVIKTPQFWVLKNLERHKHFGLKKKVFESSEIKSIFGAVKAVLGT